MTPFKDVAEAWIASREHCSGSLGRIKFWIDQFGDTIISEISDDDVDQALVNLERRGKLRGGIGSRAGEPTGQPLSGATVNRFVSTLGGIFKYARSVRAVRRSVIPPTRGIEKYPEPANPDKYLRAEEVDRLITFARVIDSSWRRLPALIIMGYHTGYRIGALKKLRWRDIDFEDRTATVLTTKNGRPNIVPLTIRCIDELNKIPKGPLDELVFRSDRKRDKPFCHDSLFNKVCKEARLDGRTFHWLRHGCGSALASAGTSQAQIMAVMGHQTLLASARYMHNNVDDKRAVISRVFQ